MSDDLSDVQLHFVDSVEMANKLLTWLGERRETSIAVDLETTGVGNFNPREDEARLCQLGDGLQGWAIPWLEWGGVFREALSKYNGPIVGHNLPQYDAPILDLLGIHIPQHRCNDTRLMSHVIEPTYSTGLKNLCTRHVDRRAGIMQSQLHAQLEAGKASSGWTWATVPVDYQPYWAYGALDTVLTARLEPVLASKVKAAGAWDAYQLELAAAYVVDKMEANGMCVDREYANRAHDEFLRQADEIKTWCNREYGFTPTQNASIVQYLQEQGHEFTKETRSGAVALDKDVLGGIDHPLAEMVLTYRQLSKLSTTYIRHFIGLTSDEDPILHYRINSIGARTGRMTMQGPSLHNLPRHSDTNTNAITVRNCLVPRAEDRILMMIDFDQIEMRVLTHLTQDPALMAAVADPDVDIFTSMARMIFSNPAITKKDVLRQRTKSCAYAINYGAGPDKFSATAGLPPAEGHEMYNQVKATFSGIQSMSDMVKNVALNRMAEEGVAYVKSPLTGRIHPAEDDKLYTLVNYLLQGLAGEIMKMKIVELDAAGFGDYMCLPVHDEQIFDAPKEGLEEFTRAALEVMNDSSLLSVPITAGASIGERWGEKRDYEP
jgi:DNA polymerase I